MTRANTWLNEDGLKVPFGTSDGIQAEAASIHTKGTVKELKLVIDFSNLPTTGTAVEGDNLQLPLGAAIISSIYTPTTVFSDAVEIGTMTAAGVEVDKNGLHTTSVLATGSTNVGSGSQIGAVLAADYYVTVRATTTTPTTGAGELVVSYSI